MAVEIFRRAYALLDDDSLPEEDRVDAVESMVCDYAAEKAPSERERLVLDILMAHHHKRSPEEAARSQLPSKPSKPIKLPQMPQNPHLSIPSGGSSASPLVRKSPEKTEPVTTPALGNAPATSASLFTPRRQLSPYDELREIFGLQNSNEDIDRALGHNDYDLVRTLEMLSTGKPSESNMLEKPSKEQVAERIMCKYFMSSGNCLRGSACMYSHDGKKRICRFWLQNHCIADDDCLFLHSVPADIVQKFEIQPEPPRPSLPPLSALPTLGAKPVQRPKEPQRASRNSTLQNPASRTNVVQFRPISEILAPPNKGRVPLVPPRLLPWKVPEFGQNQNYVELRLSAARDAELRNKFLQQATTAWSHNDPATARERSAEGQMHNDEMMKAYHTGADLLWDQRMLPSSEIYVDLHGLQLGEAVDHLEARLRLIEATEKHSPRAVYVITGRGHFRAKRIADQLSQYVKAFLDKHGYKHRDFGVDTTFGRVFGVDPWSAIR